MNKHLNPARLQRAWVNAKMPKPSSFTMGLGKYLNNGVEPLGL